MLTFQQLLQIVHTLETNLDYTFSNTAKIRKAARFAHE